LGIKYREGFIKNRVHRSHLHHAGPRATAKVRAFEVECDRSGIPQIKNVLLVDDSIVRGTTSAQIIDLAREAGARNVYFASAAPPVRYPNVYGIDMPAASELVASRSQRGGSACR
jgi:amidophosphoribosyltransferase